MGALFSQLMQFIYDLLFWCLQWISNIIIDIINALITGIAGVFQTVISWLPSQSVDLSVPPGLLDLASNINWFVPVGGMVACLALIGIAYIAYFAVRPILKFIHLA
jgi:hypothetical protein